MAVTRELVARFRGDSTSLNNASKQAQESIQRFGRATERNTQVIRLNRNAIQQAGFQVGDFAVQLASGQNALVAFTQQGSQLLQVFGPFGAVAGAALSIVGALGVAFLATGGNAEEAADGVETLENSLEGLNSLQEESRRLQIELSRGFFDARLDILELAEAQARLRFEEAQRLQDRVNSTEFDKLREAGLIREGKQLRELTEATEELREAEERLARGQQLIDEIRNRRAALRENERRGGTGSSGTVGGVGGSGEESGGIIPLPAPGRIQRAQQESEELFRSIVDGQRQIRQNTEDSTRAFQQFGQEIISAGGNFDSLRSIATRALNDIGNSLLQLAFTGSPGGGLGGALVGGFADLIGLGGFGGSLTRAASSAGSVGGLGGLGGLALGIPGFNTGGSFRVRGNSGIDKNVLSLNGNPVARVSSGETVGVTPANGGPGGIIVNQNLNFSTGVQQTVRAEVLNLLPVIEQQTVNAVADARQRGRTV